MMKYFKFFEKITEFLVPSNRSMFALGFGAYLGFRYGLWTIPQVFIGFGIVFLFVMLPSTVRLLVALIQWGIFYLFAPNPLKVLKKHAKDMKKAKEKLDYNLSRLEIIRAEMKSKGLLTE